MAPDSNKETVFEVRNLGPARTFRVTVTDTKRFVRGSEPQQLLIGANGTGLVRVQLAVPATATNHVEHDLIVVASSTSVATTNSAIVHFNVLKDTDSHGPN